MRSKNFKINFLFICLSSVGCNNPIKQDALRLGKMVQSTKFDGEFPVWHHWDCFFKSWSKLAYDVGLFSGKAASTIMYGRGISLMTTTGFNKLRWADQQKLQEKIEESHGKVRTVMKWKSLTWLCN